MLSSSLLPNLVQLAIDFAAHDAQKLWERLGIRRHRVNLYPIHCRLA
jgi:hypothetical protein